MFSSKDKMLQGKPIKLLTRRRVGDGANVLFMNDVVEVDKVGDLSDGYHTFNELYEHRCILFTLMLNQLKDISWWSKKHSDGEVWDGWVLCGVNLPTGTITYHLPVKMIHMLPDCEIETGKEWDGHESKDVIARIHAYICMIK